MEMFRDENRNFEYIITKWMVDESLELMVEWKMEIFGLSETKWNEVGVKKLRALYAL